MFPHSMFPRQKRNDSNNRDRMSVQHALEHKSNLPSAERESGIFGEECGTLLAVFSSISLKEVYGRCE